MLYVESTLWKVIYLFHYNTPQPGKTFSPKYYRLRNRLTEQYHHSMFLQRNIALPQCNITEHRLEKEAVAGVERKAYLIVGKLEYCVEVATSGR